MPEIANIAEVDLTDLLGGPLLIALRGGHEPDHVFRLGNKETDWHRHRRGQLTCVETGLVHVRTAQGSWVLPPYRAAWMPPGVPHWASLSGVLSGWSVLIEPSACARLPAHPQVMGVGEVMRALVSRAASWHPREALTPERERLVQVLLDEIIAAPTEPLHLPMPTDRRVLPIARGLLANLADTRSLEAWAESAGLSPRTARRLFIAETGMAFAEWRQQARLVHALERLAQGDPVAVVADALGYASPSNFIAMFRKAFGQTPARYFVERPGG
ncbi:AraC family transcriptional regulator [Metapseudomonas otitidis]|uniref:AraC family transcriptional regulator n=1 Tax=Metapseudomonas otitidis TaxID=319939 RepID=UPI0013F67708|nr:helix-turn-helix transcriptional regulator [Pseudomonas otitidis]